VRASTAVSGPPGRRRATARGAGASARLQARRRCVPQRDMEGQAEGPGAVQLLLCSVTSSGRRTGTQSGSDGCGSGVKG
jgi:hypothetical protein